MISVMEDTDVATAEIPGAYLHTDYYKGDIYINMEGAMGKLLK